MKFLPRERSRWLTVATFAVGMAWLEAATVYYLRAMVDRIEPYQPNPLPIRGVLGEVELVREAATLLMLLTIGMLAGRTWRKRLGLHGDCVRRVGHSVLRLPANHLRLAEVIARLGHSLSSAAAVVGAGRRAGVDRSADDRVGHGDHAGRGSISNELASVDRVGLRRNRHRPGAVRLHGRCSPHDRPGSGRHQAGPPDVIRMDVVLRCARADGCAGGTVRMANAVTPAGALVLTGSNA